MSQTDDPSSDEQKRTTAGAFSRAAPGYGDISVFHAFGARLVDLAEIPRGARVLDVACGRGAVLFPAADAVGTQGQVVGIDFAEGMVEATAAESERRGLSQVSVRRMDAEELDFPDGHFDRVLCGFAVFFFPRPYRALAEFRRVLAPGGRLAISTWGEEDHRWDWLNDLRRAYLPPPPEPQEDAAGDPRPDFRKPEGLRAFLGREGFVDIQVVTVESEPFYASPEQWWAALWTHGARVFLEAIIEKHGQEGLDQFKAEAFAKMGALRQPNGYPERHIAHFTMAARGSSDRPLYEIRYRRRRMITFALAQMRCEKAAVAENLAAIERVYRQADRQGASIVACPEMSLTGYIDPTRQPEAALQLDGPEVAALVALTTYSRATLLAGLVEANPSGKPYITHVAAQAGRLVGFYRKVTIVDEEAAWFSPGEAVPVFRHDDLSYGIAICADIDNPQVFAACAAQGAQVVFEVAAPGLYGEQATRDWRTGYEWWRGECRQHLSAYARDYGLWIAVATQAGRTVDEDFPGGGYLFRPDGCCVYETADWSEGLAFVMLDVENSWEAQRS